MSDSCGTPRLVPALTTSFAAGADNLSAPGWREPEADSRYALDEGLNLSILDEASQRAAEWPDHLVSNLSRFGSDNALARPSELAHSRGKIWHRNHFARVGREHCEGEHGSPAQVVGWFCRNGMATVRDPA